MTTSCWWSCYGYKAVLCGRHLHLWLVFDRGRGMLDVGRKEGWKELQPFYPRESRVTLHLKCFWRKPCFSRSSAPGQTLFLTHRGFPYRPEVMTVHGNKISRSGAGLDLWIFLQSSARDHYTFRRAIRLEKKPNRWARTWMWQVLSEGLCPCTRSSKGKQHVGFSS